MISFRTLRTRRTLRASLTALLFHFFLVAVPAWAASTAQPVLALSVHKVVFEADGSERLVAADAVRAGDILEYRAVYTNSTSQSLKNAQVTLPVPPSGVEYVMNSAVPAAAQASDDGKRFAAFPLMRVQAGADGTRVQRPAPAADYRFLRWDLGELPPGASRTVRARAALLPVLAH